MFVIPNFPAAPIWVLETAMLSLMVEKWCHTDPRMERVGGPSLESLKITSCILT